MIAEYFYDCLRLLLDVSVKAILLCGLAGLTIWVLRVRSDNVRHRVWTAVLAGMLLMPLLVNVTPSVPLPSWLYPELPPLAATPRAAYQRSPSPIAGSPDGSSAPIGKVTRSDTQDPQVAESRQPPAWQEGPTGMVESGAMSDASQRAAALGSQQGMLAARGPGSSPPAGSWPLAVLAIYATGLLVFLLRLLIGVGEARRLVRRGRPLSLAPAQLLGRTAVLETPGVHVPMIAGWFRPCVLLPSDWPLWSEPMLRAVLAHEQAHITRRDHWVALLAEVNRCTYWFHPVAWYVRRRLMMLAERNCDDAVIELTGDRTSYARQLLCLAGRLGNKPSRLDPLGVAMARRTNVETRIDSILDTQRPPARRIGVVGTLVLLAVTVPTVFVSAALRPADNQGSSSYEMAAAATSSESELPIAARTDVTSDERSEPRETASTHQTPPAGPAATREAPMNLSGRVLNERGEALAGAHVAAIAERILRKRGGDLERRSDVLGQATTDRDGKFRISVPGVSSQSHKYATLVARSKGHGLAWHRFDLDAQSVEAALRLPKEQVIRGRLIDNQGRPAVGVKLRVSSVVVTTSGGKISEGCGYGGETIPAAWPGSVVSDKQGGFAVHGVGVGHGVRLSVEESDQFAPQSISLNTGRPEQRTERDGTYRSQVVRNLVADEVAELQLAPAQIIEGVIRFEDTNEPVPHASFTVYSSQEKHGSAIGIGGRADDRGRFRINPYPGIRFQLRAYPPEATPYLIRTATIDWKEGDTKTRLEMTLPRGVLVRGKIIEGKSKEPIAGASIQYEPESANNPHESDDIVTGWLGIELSDDNGEFSISVLPGPGRLLVWGPNSEYVLQQLGGQEIYRGRPGGRRHYAHAFKRIEPAPGSEAIELTIPLRRGVTVEGRLLSEDGRPVDRALVISRLYIWPGSPFWRGFPQEAWGGRFSVSGCDSNQTYPVYFLDPEKRIGATAHLNAGDVAEQPMVVRLAPCGSAKARFVDSAGKPVADMGPSLYIVVTPGALRYDDSAMRRGELAADADFVSNVDRKNYWRGPRTDEDGHVTFEALIPGATYRLLGYKSGEFVLERDFSVEAGQTLNLGDIVVDRP